MVVFPRMTVDLLRETPNFEWGRDEPSSSTARCLVDENKNYSSGSSFVDFPSRPSADSQSCFDVKELGSHCTYKELYEGRSLWVGLQEELTSFALRQDPFLIDDDIRDINAQIQSNMPHFIDHAKEDMEVNMAGYLDVNSNLQCLKLRKQYLVFKADPSNNRSYTSTVVLYYTNESSRPFARCEFPRDLQSEEGENACLRNHRHHDHDHHRIQTSTISQSNWMIQNQSQDRIRVRDGNLLRNL